MPTNRYPTDPVNIEDLDPEGLYSAKQIAAVFQVGYGTVLGWAARGEIQSWQRPDSDVGSPIRIKGQWAIDFWNKGLKGKRRP